MTNVDYLFETQSVADIKEICRKIDFDFQKKNSDLRELISMRYKDIVDALDITQDIHMKCDSFVGALADLEHHIEKPFLSDELGSRKNLVSTDKNSSAILNGQRISRTLKNISRIYDFLIIKDYVKATLLFLESAQSIEQAMSSDICIPSVNLSVLIDEVSESLRHSKNWMEIALNEEVINMSNEVQIIRESLSSISILESFDAHQLLDHFLNLCSSNIDKLMSNSNEISEFCVNFFKFIYFSMATISAIFFETSSAVVSKTMMHHFKSSLTLPSPSEVKAKTKNFFNQQKNKFDMRLPVLMLEVKSLSLILETLEEISLLDLKNWNNLCQSLLSTTLHIWGNYLRDPFMNVFKKLSSAKIESSLSIINPNRLQELLQVSLPQMLWGTMSDDVANVTLNDSFFECKMLALVPHLDGTIKLFSKSFEELDTDLKLLSPSISIVYEMDISEMKSHLTSEVYSSFAKLISKLDNVVKSYPSKVLPAAFLIRGILTNCPPLVKFYDIDVTHKEYQKLHTFLDETWIKWMTAYYNRRIESFSVQLLKISDTSIEQVIDGSSFEEVTLTNSTSTIKIPTYPSSPLLDFLSAICREVNRSSCHGLSPNLTMELSLKTTVEVNRCYQEAYDRLGSANMLTPVKQKKALQCYFDVTLWKILMKGVRHEKMAKEYLPQLNALAKKFESVLDPFDFHLMSPSINKNVIESIRGSHRILSFLVDDSNLENIKKKSTSPSKDQSDAPWKGRMACGPLPLMKQ